jgi:hypothetical protein
MDHPQSLERQAHRSHTKRIDDMLERELFGPLINLMVGLLLRYSVTVLNFASKLLTSAIDLGYIIINKLAPPQSNTSRKLLPMALNPIPQGIIRHF